MSDVKDLERQLEAAYAAINELDEDLAAGRISAADHADLKARTERQAAGLMSRLRAERPAARPERAAAAPRTWRAGLWSPMSLGLAAVGLVAFGVAVGVLATRFAADEPGVATAATAPGMPPAGSPPGEPPPAGMPPAPARPPASPELMALAKEAEVEGAPIKKMLEFARKALEEGQMSAAITTYKRVLAREPKNPEALTRIGLILVQANHIDQALGRIDEALAADPKFAPAHLARAQVLYNGRQDYAGAAASLEKFLALAPKGADAEQARALLADARKQLASAPAKR